MHIFKYPTKNKKIILALGPESAGNFSVYKNEKIYFSKDFGDLLEDTNFNKFKNKLNNFLKKEKIRPNIILTDIHPLYKTTVWGEGLAEKFKARHIQIQHHLAHIFSATGDKIIQNSKFKIQNSFLGIACDGTGYGLDGKIWGGEIFKCKVQSAKYEIKRVGHLENQIMIGGDLAVKEPARMLISILSKIKKQTGIIILGSMVTSGHMQRKIGQKDFIYSFIKKFYTKNQFELLYNQLQQNFNCQKTSSTGRILDAVSILLGFCGNKRNYKHEPINLLEKNSAKPYAIRPVVIHSEQEKGYILLTTPLFEYLIKNINKDNKRLAATAQWYIANGLYKIVKKSEPKIKNIYFSGGIANNKIISSYLEAKGVITNKKIPRGDAGLSFGQIIYYLLANSRD